MPTKFGDEAAKLDVQDVQARLQSQSTALNRKPDTMLPVLTEMARGNNTAASECLRRYGPLVRSLVRKSFSSEADIEEVTQDVFVSLWRNANRFDPSIGSEATFVSTIARRRIVDGVRARARKAVLPIVPDTHLSAEAPVDRHDANAAAEALDALPVDRQWVLWLAIRQGLSHGEIATATGLPIGTVKSHFRRGVETVRQQIVADPAG
ncbi:MAG: sigma-70 family RNA polymerase sigma factor [Myxococcota bacterium]